MGKEYLKEYDEHEFELTHLKLPKVEQVDTEEIERMFKRVGFYDTLKSMFVNYNEDDLDFLLRYLAELYDVLLEVKDKLSNEERGKLNKYILIIERLKEMLMSVSDEYERGMEL